MKKSPKPSSKYSLVFATLIAFSCVCTAGVSTFAWFQAESRVRIETTSDSARVTVTAPDSLETAFYVYTGNGGAITGSSSTASAGYDQYWTKEISGFETNFSQINNATPSNSASALVPGRRLTYCIKLSGEEDAGISGTHSATITNVNDTGGRNRYLYNGGTTSNLVKLGWAINVYGTCVVTATDALPSASDIQNFIRAEGDDVFLDAPPSTVNHSSAFASATSATNKHFYFFYTIEMSNLDGTYFQQVDDSGSAVDVSPTADTSTYWEKTGLGDSEVYSGLTFSISEITLI